MNQNQQQLFSIDVEAHLKKAASHTFGSPAHYPVELVRAALRRGAKVVNITITRAHIQVKDDGNGLTTKDIETLICLMDPVRDESEKELAVESLQTREGLGLLAIFAPKPSQITVQSVPSSSSAHKPASIHFKGNRLKTGVKSDLVSGTQITLYSKHRDVEHERQLLEVFCKSVPAPRQILLNTRVISGQPFLIRQMATIEVPDTHGYGGGQMGIPRNGVLCHLRLIDRGILWHHLTLAPQQGFVFDAVIEFTGDAAEIPKDLIDHLLKSAARLYRWLSKRYSTSAPYHQDRIEELIFLQCRASGDLSLVHQFSPFKLYNSLYSLDLTRVREKVSSGALYAVPRKKENFYYNIGTPTSRTILSLTREQADLLINYLKLPIIFLSPIKKKTFRWRGIREKMATWGRRFLLSLLPLPRKTIPTQKLNPPESLFLKTLNRYLEKHPDIFSSMTNAPSYVKRTAVMIQSRRPFPAYFVDSGKVKLENADESVSYFMIRRDHPLVQRAVEAVQQDTRNIEIFISLLQ
jgi:uncharacterized protein (DUF2384 family)